MFRRRRRENTGAAAAVVESLEGRRLLSVSLGFNANAGGVDNTGFSAVLPTSKGAGLVAGKVNVSGGTLLVTTTAGDMNGGRNSQDNALDVNLNATANFVVQGRITSKNFTKNFQNGGIFVGTNQDNYVKLVVGYNFGQGFQMSTESGGTFADVANLKRSLTNASTIDVRLVGNATNHRVVGWYRINSSSESAWVRVGKLTTVGNVFSAAAKAGVVTTNFGATPITVAYDSFAVTGTTPAAAAVPATTPPRSTTAVPGIVNVTKAGGNQVETEIAINPTNPNNVVVVGQNQNNNSSSLLVSRSFDGGSTWSNTSIGGSQDKLSPGNPRVDPHVTFDGFGNLYVVYEVAASSSELRVIVARSSNGGQSFTTSTAASGPGLDVDFPLIATGPDATNLSRQTVWVAYTDYNSKRVRAVAARSTGLGNLSAFSSPVTVSDVNGSYGSIAVGPAGQVAVAYQTNPDGQGPSRIMVDVDADGLGTGRSFGTDRLAATTNVGGFDYIPAQPDRSIDAGIALAFDRSGNSATRGRLYLAYLDEVGNESNNTDVRLKFSDNLGSSWSGGIRVNNDNTTRSQFLPAMSVDPTSGNVALVWRDARNSAGNNTAELWGTVSVDHGLSVRANVRISGGMSTQAGANNQPGDDLDLGDYQGVAFYGGKYIPVWADNSNSTGNNPNGGNSGLDLYTAVVTI